LIDLREGLLKTTGKTILRLPTIGLNMTQEAGLLLKGKETIPGDLRGDFKKDGTRRAVIKNVRKNMCADRVLAGVKERLLTLLPLLPRLRTTNLKARPLPLMMKSNRWIIGAPGEVNHCEERKTSPLFQGPTGPSVLGFVPAGIVIHIVRES
jgi:hypothetical protein